MINVNNTMQAWNWLIKEIRLHERCIGDDASISLAFYLFVAIIDYKFSPGK